MEESAHAARGELLRQIAGLRERRQVDRERGAAREMRGHGRQRLGVGGGSHAERDDAIVQQRVRVVRGQQRRTAVCGGAQPERRDRGWRGGGVRIEPGTCLDALDAGRVGRWDGDAHSARAAEAAGTAGSSFGLGFKYESSPSGLCARTSASASAGSAKGVGYTR